MKKENKELAKKKKAAARKRRQAARGFKTAMWILIPCLVIAGIVGGIVYGEKRAKLNYSAGLTDDGYIAGANLAEMVTLGDYSAIPAKKSELITDKMVQDKIAETLAAKATLNKESTKTTASGDKVSIDYVGKIDGKTFQNGSATGYTLTIGEGTLVDGFEEQLVGHKAGDKFTISVTFPEKYEQNTALQGKQAEFDITLNGIYEAPELTEDYVKKNFSDHASTVEEYYQYVEKTTYHENLRDFAQAYLTEHSEISEVPAKYLGKIKNNYRAGYEAEYNYYNRLYYSYTGAYMWKDVYAYYDMTKAEFQKQLEESATESAKFYMLMQRVFEEEGMTLSEEEVQSFIMASDYTESEVAEAIKTYGEGYCHQNAMADKVMEFLAGKVVVSEGE